VRRDPNLRTEAFPLDVVQRWMQAVIVHPGEIDDALASESAEQEIEASRLEDLVKRSHSLTPEERVEIYHGMYLLRMEEALGSDYPATKHFLGDETFTELVREYIQRHPSRSYTLNRLGDHLPKFFSDEPDRENAAFLHDLASAELAITQAFDAEESPRLTSEQVQSIPQESWAAARLRPAASLRLLETRHPVTDHLNAAKRDLPAPNARRKASYLVVWRKDYSVFQMELTRTEFVLLRSLAGGAPLGEAVAQALTSLKSSESQKKVFKWFRTWIGEGMFSAVEVLSSNQ
jgi:hypothetical protein